jgi:hypothetical protein
MSDVIRADLEPSASSLPTIMNQPGLLRDEDHDEEDMLINANNEDDSVEPSHRPHHLEEDRSSHSKDDSPSKEEEEEEEEENESAFESSSIDKPSSNFVAPSPHPDHTLSASNKASNDGEELEEEGEELEAPERPLSKKAQRARKRSVLNSQPPVATLPLIEPNFDIPSPMITSSNVLGEVNPTSTLLPFPPTSVTKEVPNVYLVCLVGFDHAIGPTIEFSYPPQFEDDAELNKILPFLALPDGAHTVKISSLSSVFPRSDLQRRRH